MEKFKKKKKNDICWCKGTKKKKEKMRKKNESRFLRHDR